MDGLQKILEISLLRKPRLPLQFGEGIVSATDARMFVGFQLLYCSIVMRHECLVCVVDLGMTKEQQDWCQKQKNLIVVEPRMSSLKMVGEPGWFKYNKPYFIFISPFEKALWLDADTMVLNDLNQLFYMLEEEPFIVGSNEMVEEDDTFFRLMDKHIYPPEFLAYPRTATIGLDLRRDFWVLRDWMWVVEKIEKDCRLAANARRFDRGALAWVLAKHSKENLPINSPSWCWSAQSSCKDDHYVSYDNPEELIVSVKHDFPNAHILHFEGPIKAWLYWAGIECLDISPHDVH